MKKWNEKLFNDLEEIKQSDDYNDLVEALDPSKIRIQAINNISDSDIGLSYDEIEALCEEFNAKVNKLLDE